MDYEYWCQDCDKNDALGAHDAALVLPCALFLQDLLSCIGRRHKYQMMCMT